jgi:hypothetical protein
MKYGLMILVGILCVSAHPFSAAKAAPPARGSGIALSCTGKRAAQGPKLAEAQKSPLYLLLKQKLGAPTACRYEDGGNKLAVAFPKGGSYSDNAGLEGGTEEIVTPPQTLTREEAVAVLKQSALATGSYPPLMVDWAKLMVVAPSGGADLVAEGDACNFKVHVKLENGVVVGLGTSVLC